MEIARKKIALGKLVPNAGQIEGLPANPRKWSAEEVSTLAASIKETPELLEARGIIVVEHEKKFIILGGNMRYDALKHLGEKEAPCLVLPADTPVAKLKEIVIKDNGSFGKWDFTILASEWSDCNLGAWGAPEWGGSSQPASFMPSAAPAVYHAPTAGEAAQAGGDDFSGLPAELQGMDLTPDDLPKVEGEGATQMERIIIVYKPEDAHKLAELLGLSRLEKVLYSINEILANNPQE